MKLLCINDIGKPKEIPQSKWIQSMVEYCPIIYFYFLFTLLTFGYSMQLVLVYNKKYCPFLETISTSDRSTKKGFLFMRQKLHTKCIIDGCSGHGLIPKRGITEVFPKGYCSVHYKRLLRHGSAHIIKQRSGENRCNHALYDTYKNIKQRCYNKNNTEYHNYGARGVIMCDRWLGIDGFSNFLNDIGTKPSLLHSIDRINNNGNYEPSNCRWATIQTQSKNKRTNVTNVGVTFRKNRNKWVAQMRYKGKKILYKEFILLEDAIKARADAEKIYS